MVEIVHESGYKDDYRVAAMVNADDPHVRVGEDGTLYWTPTNSDIFRLIHLWFQAEDYEFGADGYGRAMPFYFVAEIFFGNPDVAQQAYHMSDAELLQFFQDRAERYGPEIARAFIAMSNQTVPECVSPPDAPETNDPRHSKTDQERDELPPQ